MSYIITRANENNKVGKMGKGRKISHVQTIVVDGDERNKLSAGISYNAYSQK